MTIWRHLSLCFVFFRPRLPNNIPLVWAFKNMTLFSAPCVAVLFIPPWITLDRSWCKYIDNKLHITSTTNTPIPYPAPLSNQDHIHTWPNGKCISCNPNIIQYTCIVLTYNYSKWDNLPNAMFPVKNWSGKVVFSRKSRRTAP